MSGSVWVSAGSHLAPGEATVVRSGSLEVAVFNVDGELHAVDNRCLHRDGPLAEGYVRDGVVTCPRHWWRYDLATGERVGAAELRLRSYPVEVRHGEVLVELPPPEPSRSMRELLLEQAQLWSEEQE